MMSNEGAKGAWGAKGAVLAAVLSALAIVQAQPSPWKPATEGFTFSFPRDHASHPDKKIEWWYYTGNVRAADGRRFGYQVTFFRVGIDYTPANPSKWAVRDLFMTHLAISDAKGQRYRYAEKVSRGGPGLAGASSDSYRVWNDGWTAGIRDQGAGIGDQGTGIREHVIRAIGDGSGVELTLGEGKRPAINGINGISQKGAAAGNASHYYSLTRMPTTGTLMIEGERVAVTGESWMDHEFGTSFLEPGQRGWDWLAIQLSDNRELMLYQLRREDGSRDPRSSGTLVNANGTTTHLANADFTLTPGRATFKSKNGAVYPIEWLVSIPSQRIELRVTTPLADQELSLVKSTGIAYWEGMIDVTGSQAVGRTGSQAGRQPGSQAVSGSGYLEMTGYHGSLGRVLSGQ